jgi:hypothetical protein
MTQQRKPQNASAKPHLAIEKKLVAWSLTTGFVLLVVMATINHYFPPTH